jgi:hemolysin III
VRRAGPNRAALGNGWYDPAVSRVLDTTAECPQAADPSFRPGRRWYELKDPFPAWSHWVGAVLSVAAMIVLLDAAAGRALHVIAFTVYGSSLVLLYVASALAHSVRCGERAARNFDRFDYIAIFLLIAGSYTPFCLITLRGPAGWTLFAAVWLTAAVGIAGLYVGTGKRHWPRVLTYVAMGWLSLFAAQGLLRALPRPAISWMIAGGVVYTVGALVYVTRRPRLWPGRFDYHDLWHCMVIAGSACHFFVVLKYVAPA